MSNQPYEVTIHTLNGLLSDINGALGDERPDNWTRDGILNRIEELKKGTKKTGAMQQHIQQFIDSSEVHPFVYKGKEYNVKYIENAHIIVKANRNVYEAELMNHDMCQVIGHTADGELLVRRLTDKHIGMVSKEFVSYPTWGTYPFK
jgi:hypothetical protein